uniref:C2H2-type domain-containing protein n=1 Tax=Oryza nivara TaxID=4536 RepID=A0A0E0I3C5_ORYNI
MEGKSSSRHADPLEEVEMNSASETEDDDDCRYVIQSRRDNDNDDEEGMRPATACKRRRRLDDILALLPSPPTLSTSSGSEGTISDRDHGGDVIRAGDDADPVAARQEASFPCHLCHKEFGSRKAVHGHMRVHHAENEKVPLPPPPPPAAMPVLPQARLPAPGASRSGGPYKCKYEGCNMEYKTHQGLGGHVAGHINRDKMATASGSGGAGKPEGKHPCNVCGKEYPTGVALGGHKRKHYRKDLDLTLSLAPPGELAAPPTPAPAPAAIAAVEAEAEVAEDGDGGEPVPTTLSTGARRNVVVRIWGVDVEKPVDDVEEQDGGSN